MSIYSSPAQFAGHSCKQPRITRKAADRFAKGNGENAFEQTIRWFDQTELEKRPTRSTAKQAYLLDGEVAVVLRRHEQTCEVELAPWVVDLLINGFRAVEVSPVVHIRTREGVRHHAPLWSRIFGFQGRVLVRMYKLNWDEMQHLLSMMRATPSVMPVGI